MNSKKWAYIKFPDFDHMAEWRASSNTLTEYRAFLETHAGNEIEGWYWDRGDRFAQGVHIKDDSVAIMFKLKFEL